MLVVLWSVSVLTSTIALWLHALVFDTDAWVETVGPLIDDPAVTQAVADVLVDQTLDLVDLEARLEELLPDRASSLAPTLTGAVRTWLDEQVTEALRSDTARTIWVEGNRAVHQLVVDLLRGTDTGRVLVDDGEVRLNLLPLLSRVLTFVDDKAPALLDVPSVPQITPETPPADAIAALEATFDRDLRPDFAQPLVFESDQLAAAQDLATVFDRIVYGLVAVTVVVGAIAVVLSRSRRGTLLRLGVGAVLALALATAGIRVIERQVLRLVSDPETRGAAASLIRELVASFQSISRAVLVVAALVVLVAFLAGPNAVATRLRATVGGLAAGGASRAWIARHEGVLRTAGVAVAVVIAVVVPLTLGSLALLCALLAIWEAAVWAAGRPEASLVAPHAADAVGGQATPPGVDR